MQDPCRFQGPWQTIHLLNQSVTLPDDAKALDKFLNSGSDLWRENAGYLEYLLPPLFQHLDNPSDGDDIPALLGRFLNLWLAVDFPTRTWSTYGVSRRLITYTHLLALEPGFEPALRERFWQVFYEEALYLEHFLERDVQGNHLVKNMLSLLACTTVFAKNPATQGDAQRWLAILKRDLARTFASQLLADGIHFERTPMYHVWVLLDLLDCLTLLKPHSSDLLADFPRQALEESAMAMLHALDRLVHVDQRIPLFGDSSLPQTPNTRLIRRYAETVLPDYVPLPRESAHHFDHAGYLILTANNPASSLIIKHGAIGPRDLPAHAHCDIGSLEVTIQDVPFIVDAGNNGYEPSLVRDYFRGTAAHNTLWVPGQNQAEMWGSFRVAEYPSCQPAQFESDESGTRLTLNYKNYNDSYEHRRILYDLPDTFWVLQDWLMHLHPATLSAYSLLHIHPDRRIRLLDNNTVFQIDDQLMLIPFGFRKCGWSDHSPWQPDPNQPNLNLYSPGFNLSKPGRVAWLSPRGVNDCSGWVIIPYPHPDQPPQYRSLGDGMEITLPHRQQTWALTWDAEGLRILQHATI